LASIACDARTRPAVPSRSGRTRAASARLGLFWDFWKNVAVAGGFLLVTFGTDARSVDRFFEAPFSSTHPYALHP